MEPLFDPEEKITCPYNPAHHIMRYRMNTHLVKCKKGYPESKMVECDFNVNHKIPEPELQYHHENCPDRRRIEHTVYQEEGVVLNKYPVHNIEVATDSSWDDDNVPTYNPGKYCEENEVIRRLDVASAAEKRDFRVGERHRLVPFSNKPVQQPQARPTENGCHSSARRNLPDIASTSIKEVTPESIADLTQRLQIGKNKPYIPKQK